MNFNNKHTKLNIIATIKKDISQEIEKAVNSVEVNRKMYLQAAVVRIMKVRKVLSHTQLVNEVSKDQMPK